MEDDPIFHLEWDSVHKYVLFREYCLELIETINWRNNTIFPDNLGIEQAVDLCFFEDQDGGRLGAIQVMPSTTSFKEWARFYHYLNMCKAFNVILL